MLRHCLSELARVMGGMGYRFKSFIMTDEGDYAVDDASWNYKDIIHLEHVHRLVDAFPSYISDHVLATLYHQKVLGFQLPLTMVNYVSGPGRQTYHTSFLWFILIVETHFEALGPLRTRVSTEFAIGSWPWLLALFFPLFRWAIQRNYGDLMQADIAMRERRGQLRRWGYDFFKNGAERGFHESSTLDRLNVIPAPGRRPAAPVRVHLTQLTPGVTVQIGETDHYGLQLALHDGRVEAYPRLCLHEGACLDVASRPVSGHIACPWHGLKTPPLASLPLAQKGTVCETTWHRFTLTTDELIIQFQESGAAPPDGHPTCHTAHSTARP